MQSITFILFFGFTYSGTLSLLATSSIIPADSVALNRRCDNSSGSHWGKYPGSCRYSRKFISTFPSTTFSVFYPQKTWGYLYERVFRGSKELSDIRVHNPLLQTHPYGWGVGDEFPKDEWIEKDPEETVDFSSNSGTSIWSPLISLESDWSTMEIALSSVMEDKFSWPLSGIIFYFPVLSEKKTAVAISVLKKRNSIPLHREFFPAIILLSKHFDLPFLKMW